MLTAVVLAAGAGSRLGDLGRRHSKAMVPVAGRPLIAYVVDSLREAGVERIVAVRHAADDALAAWLAAHGHAAAVQSVRRGIADAVVQALPLLDGAAPYLACACDSVFASPDIAAVIAAGRGHSGAAAVGVLDMGAAATASRSAVQVEDGVVRAIVEKPDPASLRSTLVAAPLYWLPRALDHGLEIAADHRGERHVSTALDDFRRAGGTVLAIPLSGRLEVTTEDDVARAARHLGGRARS